MEQARVVVLPDTGSGRRMWHVTLTLAGRPFDPHDIRSALERLSHEHPFLLTGRYAADRAEVRYWEESPDVDDALARARELWPHFRGSLDLPDWEVVGLEVVDRETFHRRGQAGELAVSLGPPGGLRPF